jgi:hypothetical protein
MNPKSPTTLIVETTAAEECPLDFFGEPCPEQRVKLAVNMVIWQHEDDH